MWHVSVGTYRHSARREFHSVLDAMVWIRDFVVENISDDRFTVCCDWEEDDE